jgi:hypothetical protein
VTVSGDSVRGHYEETLDGRIFGAKKICQGSVTLWCPLDQPPFRPEKIFGHNFILDFLDSFSSKTSLITDNILFLLAFI